MPAQQGGGGADSEWASHPSYRACVKGCMQPGRTPAPTYSRRQLCVQSVCLGPLPVSLLLGNMFRELCCWVAGRPEWPSGPACLVDRCTEEETEAHKGNEQQQSELEALWSKPFIWTRISWESQDPKRWLGWGAENIEKSRCGCRLGPGQNVLYISFTASIPYTVPQFNVGHSTQGKGCDPHFAKKLRLRGSH